MNVNAKIWTLAVGYALLKGDWGNNFDVIADLRYFAVPIGVDFSLALTLARPGSNGATFGGNSSVSSSADLWNGVGGFRCRIRLGSDTALFIPYYCDAGAGGSNLTWQIASRPGYHISWCDLSLTWRYLSFEQNSGSLWHLSDNDTT